jgi:hypothetical protein
MLTLAVSGKLPSLKGQDQWVPFVSAVVGVILYVMSSAKTRKERFEFRYVPDYCFRAAQAVVYLYVILAILEQTRGQQNGYDFTSWPPVLIGLLVGMFILHVEKAMEGLGQRFEEVLAGLLPRSLASPTSRDKQLEKLRVEQKYREIKTQFEGMASQIPDPALVEQFQGRLSSIARAIREGDDAGTREEVDQLAPQFEQLKIGLREEAMTVAEILGGRSAPTRPNRNAHE